MQEQIPVTAAAAATAAAKPKKKTHAVPIIIAAAAVLLIAFGLVVYFFFRTDFMHTVMGDEGYAKSVMDNTVQQLSSNIDSKQISSAWNSMSSASSGSSAAEAYYDVLYNEYGSTSYYYDGYNLGNEIISVANSFSAIGEGSGIETNLSLTADINDSAIESVSDWLGGYFSADDIKSLTGLLDKYSATFAVKRSDDNIQMSGKLNSSDAALLEANLYYGSDGKCLIALPGLTDKTLYVRLPEFVNTEESEDNFEEISKLLSKLYEIFKKYYKEADISYGEGGNSIGSIEFEGKLVTVEFDSDALAEMLEEMIEEIEDSDVFAEYFGSVKLSGLTDYVKSADCSLKLENYIDSRNTVKGFGAKLSVKSDGEKHNVSMLYISGDDGYAAELKSDRTLLFRMTDVKTDSASGRLTIEIPVTIGSETYGNTLKIDYSDVKIEEVMGSKIPVGKYTVMLNSDFIKSMSGSESVNIGGESVSVYDLVKDTTLTVNVSQANGGIAEEIGISNKYIGDISLKATTSPAQGDIFTGSEDNAVDIISESSGDSLTEIETDVLNSLINIAQSNEDNESLFDLAGCSVDNLNRMKSSLEYDKIVESVKDTLVIDGYTVVGCSKDAVDVVIPDIFTAIGYNAFGDCTKLRSVTIPDSVTEIGSFAFSGCSSLKSITIPDSVENIGGNVFYGCTSLTSITIPNSVGKIGNNAFYGCTSLTSITIPDSVTEIGYSAFYGCTSLKSITIPDSVKKIGWSAFEECSSLKSITIPYGVTNIDQDTFSGCTSLKSITIPDSVRNIGSNAFRGCHSLTSITIPNSVKEIGESAFYNCSSLTSLTIPDSLTEIRSNAFGVCFSLTSITIPNSVTYIWDGAFIGCSSLKSITIPDSVTYIGSLAFSACDSLSRINLPDTDIWIASDAFLYCPGWNG